MKNVLMIFFLILLFSCSDSQNNSASSNHQSKEKIQENVRNFGTKNFNAHWLFEESDNKNYSHEKFQDKHWRIIDLPHDWSIEHSFDDKWDGATGYLPGGVGWYRKHFNTPKNSTDLLTFINFDGIYNHSTVYINGTKIGGKVSGYTPFTLDLTSHLKPAGEDNIIAVRVDHSRYIDSRWYTGSGIYRNVTLITKPKLHIPVWGSYVTTPQVSDEKSQVNINIEINNTNQTTKHFTVKTKIVGSSGNTVASNTQTAKTNPNELININQDITVIAPTRWQLDAPELYTAITQLIENDKVIDEISTKFGIRTIDYKSNSGFYLNGKNIKIKGVNIHHDAGLVGVAVPKDVWRRRLAKLQEAGTNAIRMAHNPASQELMDLCDEMGLLVQAEIFDEWDNPKDKRLNQQERHDDYISRGYSDYFQIHAESDLKATVKRDRNHPSLIMWSIGNEIEWTYPRYAKATGYFDMNAGGNYFYNLPFITPEEIKQRFHDSVAGEYVLAKTAKKLSNWVKELDTTRPVTANMILPSVSNISGYADALDIVGYSYRRVIYDYGHKLFPDKMILGTENVVQWHEWKAVMERDFIAGTFLWTGIDYMGESHNAWPKKATQSGMLDIAGFKKPSYHLFKTLWNDEPHSYLTTQTLEKSPYKLLNDNTVVEKKPGAWQQYVWFWHDVNHHWNYQEGELIAIETYSNCQQVELFLNDVSLGKQSLETHPDRIYKWVIPYKKGTLNVKGLSGCVSEDTIYTADKATQLSLTVDKNTLSMSENQVTHIEIQLTDKDAYNVTLQEKTITLSLPEGLTLLGVDNGWHSNIQDYQSNTITTHKGKALAIVKANKLGKFELSINADGIQTSKIEIIGVK